MKRVEKSTVPAGVGAEGTRSVVREKMPEEKLNVNYSECVKAFYGLLIYSEYFLI